VTSRRTQEERIEATRERLLDAALKLLSKRGYAGFRLADVSDLSGVSRGGLLHHYPSKEALVADILESIFDRLQQRAIRQISSAGDLKSVLDAVFKSAQEFFFSSEFPIYLDLVLASREGGALLQAARTRTHQQRQWIQEFWAASLNAAGVQRPECEIVVALIWSTLRGLAITAVAPVDVADHERIINLLREMLLLKLVNAGTPSDYHVNKSGARNGD
jgi:AcrR family transcriptional regulator